MLEKIIADKLVCVLNADEEEREIYEYGLSAIISTVLTTIVLILTGLVTRRMLETFVYIIVFTVLRSQCGGYHAPTRLMCIAISTFGMILVVFFLSKITFWKILVGVSMLGIIILAPVDTPNKPIPFDKRLRFKIKSIVITIIFSVIAICRYRISRIIASTLLWVVFLMLCQLILRKISKNKKSD